MQTIMYEISYKDIFHNTGNTDNFYNNYKYTIIFRIVNKYIVTYNIISYINYISIKKYKKTITWPTKIIDTENKFPEAGERGLCNPMDCSLPGSSVYGILQARILEWAAVPSSRRSSQPRNRIQVSCIAGGFFTI